MTEAQFNIIREIGEILERIIDYDIFHPGLKTQVEILQGMIQTESHELHPEVEE